MTNTFTEVVCANGNVNLIFFDNNRQRTIIFKKNTQALVDYRFATDSLNVNDYNGVDAYYRAIVNYLRNDYRFTVNDNNVSVFYPIAKQLQTA
jgi:hypothetical protein